MPSQPDIDRGQKDNRELLSPEKGKHQGMQGFDEDYVDIVDYIIRCTHKIWEEKGMGLIYTHYGHNATVWSGLGVSYGREAVIASSIQTLAMFPDRQLFAEDVVWTGNDQDGFYTSHRILSTGHNTGYSSYGPPTNRKAVFRVIANCFVKENRILEEWMMRDDLEMIRQLGLDENGILDRLARAELAEGLPDEPAGDIDRVFGQTTPEVLPAKTDENFDIEDFIRRSMHEIWNWRMFNRVNEIYADTFLGHASTGREFYGKADYLNWVVSVIAMFPDCKFTIDHLYWLGDDAAGYRTSMRWSLVGTHDGYGLYGAPTGKRVHIWGITQHKVKDGKIIEELTLFNELMTLKQIHLARVAKGTQ